MAACRRHWVQSSFATDASRAGASPARAGGGSGNCAVPPSGIEPEPLGLQPSAQTNYARVGYERRARGAHLDHSRCLRSPRGADHHHRSSVVREQVRRAHLPPSCERFGGARTSGVSALACLASAPIAIRDLNFRSRVAKSDCRGFGCETRNVEGPPGFPWRPFRTRRVVTRYSWDRPP